MKSWLILTLLVVGSVSLVCHNTRLEFFSHFSLGRQDELNRTFTSISKNLTIPEVFYNFSDTQRYRIGDYNITWRYLDTNQKANVTGSDTVIVWGGKLRIDVAFNWNLTGATKTNGTGQANALTDEILFVKELLVDSNTGFIMWNLRDHETISFNESKFTITRFSPPSDADEDAVGKMLNHIVNGTGFRDYLLEGVNNLMDFHLNASLHEEHFQEEKFVNYTYKHPTKGNLTVNYEQILDQAIINTKGLHILTSQVIRDYPDYNCGKQVPSEALDTDSYGGLQTLISMGFVESNAKWALSKGIFDTDLSGDTWQSRHFQFYAGDLYDVIPALQKKYYPNQPLNGNCKALNTQNDSLTLIRGSIDTFNVTIKYNCSLNVNTTGKILDFSIAALFVVRGHPQEHHIDFVVNHTEFNATYYPTGEFNVTNKELADYYVTSTSWALWNTKVFGSNFSIISRDFPHFEVSKNDYIIIYDSSHIGQA